MQKIIEQFLKLLKAENKEFAVKYILEKLETKEIDVTDMYSNILTPSLNQMECSPEEEKVAVYKEHVKTAIVRTILECSYPYVLLKRDELGLPRRGVAIILCPPEEYHELGARMAADFFTIAGYETVFTGSNMPYQDVYNALHIIKPELIAISVTNYFNLVAAKKMITELKQMVTMPTKIVVGGHAFQDDENKYRIIGADYYVKSLDDILAITRKEVTHEA